MRASIVLMLTAAACAADPISDALPDAGEPASRADAGATGPNNPCTLGCIVTTVAGDGSEGFSDGPGAAAAFDRPTGVALTASGDVLVADMRNHVIRKIAGGEVSTLAGSGVKDWIDGALAVAAFSNPRGVAVGADGTIYVADTSNHRIRAIAGGQVSTIAGSGGTGVFNGGHADGPANASRFNMPSGIAVSPNGDVYVADSDNHVIRRITGGQVTTIGVAGSEGAIDGAASRAMFRHPTGVAVGAGGEVYVADWGNHRVRRIANDEVSTLAGTGAVGIEVTGGYADGPAQLAEFAGPWGIAVDSLGRVLVADSRNHRVRVILLDGAHAQVETLAGSGEVGFDGGAWQDGEANRARFSLPRGIAVGPSGDIAIGDYANQRIRVIEL